MSDIKKGDLVMVISPTKCCGASGAIGNVFEVANIGERSGFCRCGEVIREMAALDAKDGLWAPFYRLIKIDPPPIYETTEKEMMA